MGDDVNDVVIRTFACARMRSQDHRETRRTIGDSVRRQFWHSLTLHDDNIRDERERPSHLERANAFSDALYNNERVVSHKPGSEFIFGG